MADKTEDKHVDYSLTKKEIKFSDSVRVQSKQDSFLLTFTQNHPDLSEFICVAQISLPPEVAASLGTIIMQHAITYEKKSGRKIIPKGVTVESETKNQTKH